MQDSGNSAEMSHGSYESPAIRMAIIRVEDEPLPEIKKHAARMTNGIRCKNRSKGKDYIDGICNRARSER